MVTLGATRPGRADLGVELNPEIEALLSANAPVAIGVSGGKDSVAAAFATIEHLDAIGHTGPRVLIHADLGDPDPRMNVEWSDSLPTCERLAGRLGVELLVVRRPAGGMMARWQKRQSNNHRRYANLSCVKIILPWSTPKMRFCTSELKSSPMAAALVKRFPGQTIVSACGVRRDESKERSKAKCTRPNNRLVNKANRTLGIDWNPIAAWSKADVYALAAARDFPLHEGYTRYGMSRISCRYCIMAKRSDLVASTTCEANVPVFLTMVALEISSTFAFQGSTWLADVAPHLLDAGTAYALQGAKFRAARREAIEARIPDHLLYEKGWPKAMPTRDEATLLCEVRIEVAELLGITVRYTDPDAVLGRYAELMAENAQREAAKAAKAARKAVRSKTAKLAATAALRSK